MQIHFMLLFTKYGNWKHLWFFTSKAEIRECLTTVKQAICTSATLHIQLNTSCWVQYILRTTATSRQSAQLNSWKQLSNLPMLALGNMYFTPALNRHFKSDAHQELTTWLLNTQKKSGYQTIVRSNQKTSLPEQAMTLLLILQSKLDL